MRPSRRRSPEEYSRAVSPSQLASWRPEPKRWISTIAAHSAVAQSREHGDLGERRFDHRPQRRRHRLVGGGECRAHRADATARTQRDADPELAQRPAQPVELLDRLLLDRLDRHRADLAAAGRLEQRTGIRGIGLVALHIGAHVLRRQQPHLVPLRLQAARPVLRRAAGLHHHHARRMVAKEPGELTAAQLRAPRDPILAMRHRQLEAVLCQVNADGRVSMTDSFCQRRELIHQLQLGTSMPYRQPEESISSLERSVKPCGRRAAGARTMIAPAARCNALARPAPRGR